MNKIKTRKNQSIYVCIEMKARCGRCTADCYTVSTTQSITTFPLAYTSPQQQIVYNYYLLFISHFAYIIIVTIVWHVCMTFKCVESCFEIAKKIKRRQTKIKKNKNRNIVNGSVHNLTAWRKLYLWNCCKWKVKIKKNFGRKKRGEKNREWYEIRYRFKAAVFVVPIFAILTFLPSSVDEPPLTEAVANMLLVLSAVPFVVSILRFCCFGFTSVFGRCAAVEVVAAADATAAASSVFGFGGLFNALLKWCCRSKFKILADGDNDDEAATLLLPFWFAFSLWSKFNSNFKLCGGDLSSTGTIYDNILMIHTHSHRENKWNKRQKLIKYNLKNKTTIHSQENTHARHGTELKRFGFFFLVSIFFYFFFGLSYGSILTMLWSWKNILNLF